MNPSLDNRSRQILDLVIRGEATSRTQLAAALGIAASTVGLKVQGLIDGGLLRESGRAASSGGRPRRTLCVDDAGGDVLTVDLGGSHARLGRHAVGGDILDTREITHDLTAGPASTLEALTDGLQGLADGDTIRAIGLSLPGPVDIATGTVQLPSRMPGWSTYRLGEALAERFGVTVAVDNDANLAALGEHSRQFGSSQHSITVKAGTAIGSGIIVNGRLHRGATHASGDISHTRIDRSSEVPCSCGNTGCLETMASGAGLMRQLREHGVAVERTADIVALAGNADPLASRIVRRAGHRLGEVLSGVVNFFNPHAVFLTGSLSSSEPFIAAIRSRVYEGCHPLVTRALRIEAASTGANAILYGAARLAIDSSTTT